jgi:hypothetical protein
MPSNSVRMSPMCETGTPTFPYFAAREHMIAVVAGLGRQIESDRKPGLTLGRFER